MNINSSVKREIVFSLVFGMLMLISACKYTNQQNDIIKSLEESGVDIPNEIKDSKSFNMADILFPLGGLLTFGVFIFMGIKQFKRKKAQIGYAFGDINDKINSIKNNSEISEKMTDEEKKNLDNVLNFLNKGTNND